MSCDDRPSNAPSAPAPSSQQRLKASRGENAMPEFSGPRQFGRLVLLKGIARGGMGEVYLAATGDIEGAERPCVVKLIRSDHRDDASFLARFLDEARIQSQMQHPGVAQILDAAVDEHGQPYVVVEHVSGRDLAELRQRALRLKVQLSWSEAVAIAARIADALAHVHERTDAAGKPLEVAHRDLSPQNIMVSYSGEVKLIDFGTARGENRRCQTVNGIVFAKPGYVAPEVAANTPGGAPADLYALGIVLWELIAGRRFLQGDTQEHLAAVARGDRLPPSLCLWLTIPKEVDAIIAKLTAHRIEDRYASAREAAQALHALLAQAQPVDGHDRTARAHIAQLMLRLYPAEPARSRSEFARLVEGARARGVHTRRGVEEGIGGASEESQQLPRTRYRIVREISRGPMSVVYEAQHMDLDRKVALKVLDRSSCSAAGTEASFRKEAQIVAQLHHENLVQVHDFGIAGDGRAYYAMEFLEGSSLSQHLKQSGTLAWREAVDLAVQACKALECAHALDVVHRDIKPDNLFLTSRGVLKLLDFGITHEAAEGERSASEPFRVVGTPEYMAPEQVGRTDIDGRADIYALGVVLYELLTGQLPHTGNSTVELLDNKLRNKAQPPSKAKRGLKLPSYLDKVVCTALANDPKLRYDEVEDFRRDLEWVATRSTSRTGRALRMASGTLAVSTAVACCAYVLGTVPGWQLADDALQTFAAPSEPAPLALDRSLAQSSTPEAASAANAPAASASPAAAARRAAMRRAAMRRAALSSSSAAGEPPDPSEEERLATQAEAHIEQSLGVSALEGVSHSEGVSDSEGVGNSEGVSDVEASDNVEGRGRPTAEPNDGEEETTPPQPPPVPNEVPGPEQRRLEELRHELARAEVLIENGRRIKALEVYRQLGRKYSKEPEVLAGWSKIAAKTKWWGESLKVAKRWAKLDPSVRAQLHLARTQRRMGQTERAIATLESVLQQSPHSQEAAELLELYGGSKLALNR